MVIRGQTSQHHQAAVDSAARVNSAAGVGQLMDSFSAAIQQLNSSLPASPQQQQQQQHDVPAHHHTAFDNNNSVYPPPCHTYTTRSFFSHFYARQQELL